MEAGQIERALDSDAPERHQIVRVRREPRRRLLTVRSVEALTPTMRRVRLTSPDLADFESAGFDDHIKLFFPTTDGSGRGPGGALMRDYTPRAFDPAAGELTIDFVLHEGGPATSWARDAAPGFTLAIGGPRGSAVIPDDFDWHLLIGDETALPAIGRRLEELRPGVPAFSIVVVEDASDIQTIATVAAWSPRWVTRDHAGPDDATSLGAALADFTLPPGEGFIWIGAEARVAAALRAQALAQLNHPPAWMKAAGYWVKGVAGESERLG